jgi:hypothetical protein
MHPSSLTQFIHKEFYIVETTILPTKSATVRVTVDIPEEKQQEFHRLWLHVINGEDNPVSRSLSAEKVTRAHVAKNGIAALKRLYEIANGDTGQAKIVAKFLACLYNGNRFPFDLTDLRIVDQAIFEDCMALLRMDARQCEQEVHEYFEHGSTKWEKMIHDWGLSKD